MRASWAESWDESIEQNGMDVAKDTSALDTRTDAEIHFNGRAATDDGMKFHARVELEGQNNHSQCVPAGDPPKCTSGPDRRVLPVGLRLVRARSSSAAPAVPR